MVRGKSRNVTAQVRVNGLNKSKTFPTKAEARSWANQLESEILAGHYNHIPDIPMSRLFERYRDTVSPTKRGVKWEVNRLNALLRDPLANISARNINTAHMAEWRDRRLSGTPPDFEDKVSPSTVRRDWNLLSAVCNTAVNEWKWLGKNPLKGVKKPAPAPD
ncbi:MAG: site-specific integrase, partial [Burkholderiales bacterium]